MEEWQRFPPGNFKEDNIQLNVGSHTPSDLKSAAVPNLKQIERIRPEDCLARHESLLCEPLSLLYAGQTGTAAQAFHCSRAEDAAAIWRHRRNAKIELPAALGPGRIQATSTTSMRPEHAALRMENDTGEEREARDLCPNHFEAYPGAYFTDQLPGMPGALYLLGFSSGGGAGPAQAGLC